MMGRSPFDHTFSSHSRVEPAPARRSLRFSWCARWRIPRGDAGGICELSMPSLPLPLKS